MSIDKRELMLNNFILYCPYGKGKSKINPRTVRVKKIYEKSCIVVDKGLELELFYEGASTQPIPITPQLLSMIEGFKENRIEIAYNRWLYYAYDDNWEIENYSGETMLELKIAALHQLQNTFFCLSGNELKLNNKL